MVLHARRKKRKLHSGQKKPKTAVKSKRFMDKVMGLCAVGRPKGDFKGIIEIYRCSQRKRAERKSKYHEAGDLYEVDCELTGSRFVHMIKHQLIPDI